MALRGDLRLVGFRGPVLLTWTASTSSIFAAPIRSQNWSENLRP